MISALGALMCVSCGAKPSVTTSPGLTLSLEKESVDGIRQVSLVRVRAWGPNEEIASGPVTLSANAGEFVEGSQVELNGGQAVATFRCFSAKDFNCRGVVHINAQWENSSDTIDLRVGLDGVSQVAWQKESSGTTLDLNDVSASGGSVWAVGDDGVVVHSSSLGFVTVPCDTHATLEAVWAAGDQVWAVGEGGALLHLVNDQLVTVPSTVNVDLHAIAGADENHIWAAGEEGTLLFFDGTQISKLTVDSNAALRSLYVLSSTDVWLTGDVWVGHYDGTAWKRVFTPGTALWNAVYPTPEALWLAGQEDPTSSRGTLGIQTSTDWTTLSVSTIVRRVWWNNDSERWAVSEEGIVYRQLEGAAFVDVQAPAGARGISGANTQDVWVSGAHGLLMHRKL